MDAAATLSELYDRLPDLVRAAVDGLTPEQLRTTPGNGANSAGWLVWHLARVQDSHVAELLGDEQVWASDAAWAAGVGLDPDPGNTGYGHGPDEVAAVRPESSDVLIRYFEAVAARTGAYLRGLTDADLDQVVDKDWDPPVTLGARLVSVAEDDLQHVGQAAYVRGLLG